jgi:hypothetical protein
MRYFPKFRKLEISSSKASNLTEKALFIRDKFFLICKNQLKKMRVSYEV